MVKLVVLGLVLFVAFSLIVSLFQKRILFPTHLVGRAEPLPMGTQRLTLDTADGYQLHGVHIPPSRDLAGERLLILGFAGNAWNSADAADYLSELYPEAHVVAFHYRGYSPSTGTPSAKALVEDAPLVFDAAVHLVKPQRVVTVGFSIGTGVAASLAERRPVDGLILVTPFDSLKAVAQAHYPWLPLRLFFHEDIDAARALRGNKVPVAIIGAGRDTLIPASRTNALRRRVPNLVFEQTIARAGHNDIYQTPELHDAMRKALSAITAK
jgi:pimeloyl-ACP methyl ester carboxylesterase